MELYYQISVGTLLSCIALPYAIVFNGLLLLVLQNNLVNNLITISLS